MTKFLLITHDFAWSRRIRAVLPELESGELHMTNRISGATFGDTVEVLDETDPTVVIIGPDIDSGTALGLTRAFDERLPIVTVVLIADSQPWLLERAVRAGARDVIDPLAGPEDLRMSLRDVLARATRRRDALLSHSAAVPATRNVSADGSPKDRTPGAHGVLETVATQARRMTPAGMVDGLQRRVDLAGLSERWPVDRLLATKLTGIVLGGVFGLLYYISIPSMLSFLLVAIVAGVGYFGPDLWIARTARPTRRQNVRAEGLEPSPREGLGPKPSASADSATLAYGTCYESPVSPRTELFARSL
jgi:DNA-binding NarL/FixJ family response regulator